MQNAVVVGVVNRLADRHQQPGRVLRRHRAIGQLARQGRPLDELHGEIRLPIVLADLEDRYDVRMGQAGCRQCTSTRNRSRSCWTPTPALATAA